ncbi:hypothetical protein K402DRAFT_260527 [Aulographum hederae CBS 113979]|uniref:Uncharacterized protein n=1 Tax=Aulographum hederae CBS 113979 TaxID=1176131 RepID=A0A6G1H9N2_9PEZI|nr:hypothetical protein K402DRAFT_260527 [Aulographum hederae CBS 113979]
MPAGPALGDGAGGLGSAVMSTNSSFTYLRVTMTNLQPLYSWQCRRIRGCRSAVAHGGTCQGGVPKGPPRECLRGQAGGSGGGQGRCGLCLSLAQCCCLGSYCGVRGRDGNNFRPAVGDLFPNSPTAHVSVYRLSQYVTLDVVFVQPLVPL